MKNPTPSVHNILLAAAFALPLFAMTSAARAGDADAGRPPMMQGNPDGAPGEPGMEGPSGGPRDDLHDGRRGGPHDGPPDGPRGFGPRGPGGPGHGGRGPGGFPFHGIELTEAQEDKVFAILHAEEPYLRDQSKAAAKAHEALHALATTDKYDDAKAASLAQAAATAMANISLQHVRTEQKLLAVLTPEQRKKQTEQMADDKQHRPRP